MSDANKFVTLRRPNGEILYFSLSAITFIHDNPENRTVTVVGSGWEKVLKPEEAKLLLEEIARTSGLS